MCKCLTDWICCCCCLPSRSRSKNDQRFSKMFMQKQLKQNKKKTTSTTTYGTNWETLVHQVPMSASQIQDSMITRDIAVDKQKYKNREDVYKFVLKDYVFSMDNKLGKGGFGEVYKIKEKVSGEWRAVKIMKLTADSDMSRHRFDIFKNEVFSLRKNPHKNIIQLIDHSMVSTLFISFLIMEFAEGGDLLQRLKQVYKKNKTGFPENETKTYFVQIANAIHFVHSNGLIHGDLKLENVLITKAKDGKEVIKVSDFGCARVAFKEAKGVLKTQRAVGTVAYMAPEQIRVYVVVNLNRPDLIKNKTKSYNPIRADVWSLGVCLYRMIFYYYPFECDHKNELQSALKMLEQMKKGYEMPTNITKDFSNECIDMLTDLMEYNKNKRIDMKIVMKHKWIHDSPYLDTNEVQIIGGN